MNTELSGYSYKRVLCPGRVNLIGDHTDYAMGLAMPMAISLYTQIEFQSDPDAESLTVTTDIENRNGKFFEELRLDFKNIPQDNRLADFLVAASDVLGVSPYGTLKISSNIPIGAGLSSSASFVIALLLSFKDLPLDLNLAKMAQEVERRATMAETGLLDQLAIIYGKKGSSVLINFNDNSVKPIVIPNDLQILVVHSGITRQLSESNYKLKVDKVRQIERLHGKLSDMNQNEIKAIREPDLQKVAKHIVSENNRVIEYSHAMASGDLDALKEIIYQSHISLAYDYEVSLPEIDRLVSRINSIDGVVGARLTGGGFGGCIVALTKKGQLDLKSIQNLGKRTWFVDPAGSPDVTKVSE